MLKFLRDNANSWIMKILLGILVLSFGVFWGVAEFFRSPSAANNVATIGKLSVSKQDLVRSVQQEMNRINAQLKGQNITFAQALRFGLVSQTLVRIVNEILIEMFMKDTKLTVSEQAIANLIFADPVFKNSAGQFDKEKFKRVLAANQLTEASFFKSRQRALGQMNLLAALRVGQTVPASLVYPLFQVMTQKRKFDVVKIDAQKIKVHPGLEAQKDFYQQNVTRFSVPEYRTARVVVLDPQSYGKDVSVSEKELREYYDGNKETLTSSETRSFSIAVFDTKKAADSARASYIKNKSGISFEKHEAMTQDVLDPEIGAIVFTLKKDDISSVKNFQGKYALVKVDHIVPAKTKSFSDVRPTLVSDVRRQKAMEVIAKTVSKIEEGSNQGMSFSEIVKSYKLKEMRFTIDRSGLTEKGQNTKLASDIVKDVFSLHEGGENQITELADGTSYLVHVEKILPTRTLSFKEAQNRVVKEYSDFLRMAAAEKVASRAVEDMAKGKKILPTDALSFLTIGPVSLSDQKKTTTVPLRVLYQGFAQSKGVPFVVKEGNQVYVIKTTDVQKIKIEKNIGLYKVYREDVGRAISQSIYIGFLRDLKKIYNLKINQQALESLV